VRALVSTADEVEREEDRLEVDALMRNIKTSFSRSCRSPPAVDDLQPLAMNITEAGASPTSSPQPVTITDGEAGGARTLDVRARLDC